MAVSYAFFDHTGDIGVDLQASRLGGLFEVAAVALTQTLCGESPVRPLRTERIALEAAGLELLLVDWLNELLYRCETRQWLTARSEVEVTGGPGLVRLAATIIGERFDSRRHAWRTLVKSVTYHGLVVEPAGEGWRARVIFDV